MLNYSDNHKTYPQLLKSRLLKDLPDQLAKHYLSSCDVKIYDTPEILIEQGQPSKGIFLIAHGRVEISRLNHDGQNVYMSVAESGSCVGEIEAIAGKDSIANCMAEVGTIILFLPTKKLKEFLGHYEFVKNIALIFLERLEYNNSFRSIDKLDPVDLRLRSYLHFMSRKSLKIDKNQTDLAAIICCSRQTVNKELGKLRAQGIIELHSGEVSILDRQRLAEGIDQP